MKEIFEIKGAIPKSKDLPCKIAFELFLTKIPELK